jgi:hypothetical protein
MGARIRYLVLSPVAGLRETLLGNLFGAFESSAQASGERVLLPLAGGGSLEVVGAGSPGRLASVLELLLSRGVELDGVLLLLPSGDQAGWEEGKAVRDALAARPSPPALRAFVIDPFSPPDKEGARAMFLALLAENERLEGVAR